MKAIAVIHQSDPHQVAATLKQYGVQELIIIAMEANTTGVLTDIHPDFEFIRVGYPIDSKDEYFNYLEPAKGKETGLSIVLERTMFNRTCYHAFICEPELVPAAKHAFKKLDVKIGWGKNFRTNFWLTKSFIKRQVSKYPLLDSMSQNTTIAK